MADTTDEIREFLNKLYRGTKDGLLTWEAESETAFNVATPEGRVELWSRDGDDRHPFRFRVLNKDEIPVVDFTTAIGEVPENYDTGISELYEMVKNDALGISSTLRSIAQALKLDDE